jgi:tRNA threonylcarbamoyladenosine modification (KEOPS) complex  Pcc1 subunit
MTIVGIHLDVRATLSLDLPGEDVAKTVLLALSPETDSAPSDRAKVELSLNRHELTVMIQAHDLTALRAAMNSYLAWISSSLKTLEFIGQNP